ncbi:hypothetical protein HN682_01020 [Candidatus Peregrinibacteria bacterium]|jgi:hypothetical protein|nr:hypothetical protein [Candidatus Peregrinibacteria bacterium]
MNRKDFLNRTLLACGAITLAPLLKYIETDEERWLRLWAEAMRELQLDFEHELLFGLPRRYANGKLIEYEFRDICGEVGLFKT